MPSYAYSDTACIRKLMLSYAYSDTACIRIRTGAYLLHGVAGPYMGLNIWATATLLKLLFNEVRLKECRWTKIIGNGDK